jgi:hypothetical protein
MDSFSRELTRIDTNFYGWAGEIPVLLCVFVVGVSWGLGLVSVLLRGKMFFFSPQ